MAWILLFLRGIVDSVRSWPIVRKLLEGRVRTPALLQMEAVECGAAALGIILAHYGRQVPLTELRRNCGVSRDGSQAAHLLKAGRGYGMEGNAYSVEFPDLRNIPGPYIVFWNFNHFLVVEGIGRHRVHLNDPETGRRTVSVREFSESYAGVVLYFAPGEGFERGGRRPSALRGFGERFRECARSLVICALLGFLLVLPGIAIPLLAQLFVDGVLVKRIGDWLWPIVLGMAMTAVLRGALTLSQMRLLRTMRARLAVSLSGSFLRRLLQLPMSFYAQRHTGEIAGRVEMNGDVAALLTGRFTATVLEICTIPFYALLMFYYDPVLASMGVASACLSFLSMALMARRYTEANMRLGREHGKVRGLAVAGFQGIETLKASGLESGFFARWGVLSAKLARERHRLGQATQALGVVQVLLVGSTNALVLLVGGARVVDGAFSVGMLVAFQSLMQSFMTPLTALPWLGGMFQQLRGELILLDDVLYENQDVPTSDETAGQESSNETCSRDKGLELKGVGFGYNPQTPPFIEDLNLLLRPGERVAIVGPSGSGKSTISKLVCGLYEPWQGEILIHGRPRSEFSLAVLGMVEQEIFLFEGSVRENLSLWSPSISEEDLQRACRDACIHDDILLMPGGYDAMLEEGGRNLSGGQRERLEIARALAKNPSILVLDEATSTLDAEMERQIDQNLRRRGCACLIMAHRLNTVRDCEEIIVLRDGKIVERGNHERLLSLGGYYAALTKDEGDPQMEAAS